MTDCKYIRVVQKFGSADLVLDVAAFTADLAAELGGTVLPSKSDMPSDAQWYGSFELDGAVFSVTKQWNAERTGKVTVRACAPTIEGLSSYNDTPSNRDKYKLPEASVSVKRPLAALAKDVTRRVIEPSIAPRAERNDFAAKILVRRKYVATVAEILGRDFPGLSVRLDQNGDGASLYASEPYLSGRLYSDGTVTIERLSSLSVKTFTKIWAALGKEAVA